MRVHEEMLSSSSSSTPSSPREDFQVDGLECVDISVPSRVDVLLTETTSDFFFFNGRSPFSRKRLVSFRFRELGGRKPGKTWFVLEGDIVS